MNKSQRFSKEALTLIVILVVVIVIVWLIWVIWLCPSRQITTIFLVRHAEYEISTGHLTPEGIQRANELVEVLNYVDIDAIYVSQRIRTQETAQPLADETSITPIEYDRDDLDSLVAQVMQDQMGNKVVIVGHSDTVTDTIDLLIGENTDYSIGEYEFYKIFILTISGSDEWWVTQTKYGAIP